MTIERKTSYFGLGIRSKPLEPDPNHRIPFASKKIGSNTFIKEITVLSADSVRVDNTIENQPLPVWFLSRVRRRALEPEVLYGEDVNNANLESKRFFGIKRERIIWKP